MPLPQRASLITLGVDDVEVAAAFYESLGWRRSSASVLGEVAFFATGGVGIALWSYDNLSDDARLEAGARPPHSGVALAMNLASPDAVIAALDAAEAAGATVTKPGTPTEWGGFSGYFKDPQGHLWEVAHNPFWELGEDGRVVLPPPSASSDASEARGKVRPDAS